MHVYFYTKPYFIIDALNNTSPVATDEGFRHSDLSQNGNSIISIHAYKQKSHNLSLSSK